MNAARDAAVDAIIAATAGGTPRPVNANTHDLSPADARLAEAIHRTCMQRWLTVKYLLDRCLEKPRIEPALRAILAAGATQLLFMDRLPAHAVVDTAVEQAKRRVRRGAAGLTNAVLRRVADLVAERVPDEPWQPRNNRIPWGGGQIRFTREAMLKPRRLTRYLSVATSHAQALVDAWLARYDQPQAIALLTHSLEHPPTFVHSPAGVERWRGDHAQLAELLATHRDHWVQDPTSAKAVAATASRSPTTIVDFCAGKGTKTRQLLATHPRAKVIAGDVDEHRFDTLRRAFADEPRVVVTPPALMTRLAGQVDLLVLDVPCSNTGVLARRPEAKYRYNAATLASVVALQRQIVEQAAPLLSHDGVLLYATCSIETQENDQQARWIADTLGMTIDADELTLPGGEGETYHDGGYWAKLWSAASGIGSRIAVSSM